LIAAGLICNRWALEAVLAADGKITSVPALTAVYLSQALLVGAGALCVVRPPSLRRPRIADLLLLTAGIVAALGVAEIALRQFRDYRPRPRTFVGDHPNRPRENFVVDETTGWRMRPSHRFTQEVAGGRVVYHSNRLGFRCRADSEAPRGDAPIIALTGDSFTWGSNVDFEETWGARVAEGLPGCAVHNRAMPGFGIDQMWMSVRSHALPLQPDLIVVAFIDRDFDRSLSAYRRVEGFNKPTFLLRGGVLTPRAPADRPNRVVRLLEARSYLWTAGRNTIRQLGFRLPVGEWWHLNAAILSAIQRECERSGVRVLFVRMPLRDWKDFPMLRSFMRQSGASYIDLVEAGPPPGGVHFDDDPHIDGRGHEWVAEHVLRWVRKTMPHLGTAAADQRPAAEASTGT
jgi:hypothetical protein